MLPVTTELAPLAAEVRAAIAALPPLPAGGNGAMEKEWVAFLGRVRAEVAAGDLARFLRWRVIQQTMFVKNTATSFRDWGALRRSPLWSRWKGTLVENKVGDPIPFLRCGRTSGNQVRATRYVAEFEERTGSRVDQMGLILEFGGGYGNMCRQVHRVGFRGKYVIFDLPEFSAVQRYYLRAIGLPVLSREQWVEPKRAGIFLVSDADVLGSVIPGVLAGSGPGMFVGTWSLGESPLEVRGRITPLLGGFGAFLITYMKKFGSVDNLRYFGEFTAARPDVRWSEGLIERSGVNRYLYGARVRGVV